MNNQLKDNFEIILKYEDEFLNLISDITTGDEWLEEVSCNMKLVPLEKEPIFLQSEMAELSLQASEDMVYDTMQNSQMCLKINGKHHLLRKQAIKDLLLRAGLSGSGVSKLRDSNPQKFAEAINIFLTHAQSNKTSSILMRGGKITSFHGEIDVDYVIMPQTDLFEVVQRNAKRLFATFIEGSYSHSITAATYLLPHSEETSELEELGILSGYTPALEIRTSDAGVSSASITTSFIVDGVTIPCGTSLNVPHRSGASLEKFESQFDSVFSILKDGMSDLIRLSNIRINNPELATTRIAKLIGLPTKIVINDLGDMALRGQLPTNAFEIYYYLSKCIKQMKLNKINKLNLLESLARILHRREFPWNTSEEEINLIRLVA